VPLEDGRLLALDLRDGALQWQQRVSGRPSSLALARDRVFVGSTDNYLYALDDRNGTLRWRWRAGGDVVGIAADDDHVYFVALDNLLRALNRGNGNQRWRVELPSRPAPGIWAVRDEVLAADLSPGVSAFDTATGATRTTVAAPGDLAGPPLVDGAEGATDVHLVLLTLDGRVTGLRPAMSTPPSEAPSLDGGLETGPVLTP
jgi:outer membrane protein assembly factor BamB